MIEAYVTGQIYVLGNDFDMVDSKIATFDALLAKTQTLLKKEIEAAKKVDETLSQVLESYLPIINDTDVAQNINQQIANGQSLINALDSYFEETILICYENHDTSLFSDIREVLGLFKQALHGCTRQYIPLNEETIVVAKTFTTSDLLYFPLEKVKAFVCMQGAKTSHFSEVTAKLNIPFFINKKMMISNN